MHFYFIHLFISCSIYSFFIYLYILYFCINMYLEFRIFPFWVSLRKDTLKNTCKLKFFRFQWQLSGPRVKEGDIFPLNLVLLRSNLNGSRLKCFCWTFSINSKLYWLCKLKCIEVVMFLYYLFQKVEYITSTWKIYPNVFYPRLSIFWDIFDTLALSL